jgi:hypothetical protein
MEFRSLYFVSLIHTDLHIITLYHTALGESDVLLGNVTGFKRSDCGLLDGLKMAVFWIVAPCSLVMAIALMMEAARTSETLVNFYQATRRYNPEDSYLRTHRLEDLKSYVFDDLSRQRDINIFCSISSCRDSVAEFRWDFRFSRRLV